MSKLFTKYIPVEEEIKEGDSMIDTDMNTIAVITAPQNFPQYAALNKSDRFKKVKLFLCSRDIPQLKDEECVVFKGNTGVYKGKYKWTNGVSFKVDDTQYPNWDGKDKYEAIKVIGEVSPSAIWIKEGMEFEEDQVHEALYQLVKQKGYEGQPGHYDHLPSLYEFKCPTCGTFH